MPISYDKRNKRFRFHFRKVIDGNQVTKTKLLPAGWTKSQADAYDRSEVNRIYLDTKGISKKERTIDEAVMVYLTDKPHLKNMKGMLNQLRVCLDWYEGVPISKLPSVVRKYSVDNPSLSAATIRNRMAYLRAACRHAWKYHDFCEFDPGSKLVMPRVRNERSIYLSRSDVLKICREVKNRQARIGIRVAYYSGMRENEILTATIEGHQFVLQDTKNDAPRVIPIHPRIAFVERLWPLRISKWHLSKCFKDAVRICGIDARFHDLRHSAASAMIQEDVHLYTVGAVLGHKSQQSTKRYAHLATTQLAEAVNRIGRK